jgi:hypothetical protein
MPSAGWVWAMFCWWTVIVGVFVGYTMVCLGRISRAMEVVADTYTALNGEDSR